MKTLKPIRAKNAERNKNGWWRIKRRKGAEKFENETQNVHVTCKYFTKAECLSIYAPFADAGCQSNKSLVW